MSQINESAIKTPGVYVTEIPSFPPSIAQVATAVPAFIGYTELANKDGKDLTMTPTRIASLIEYQLYFGGGYTVKPGDVTIALNGNYSVHSVTLSNTTSGAAGHYYYMFDAIRQYFDNGGAVCYIVSVGKTGNASTAGDQIIGGDDTLATPTGLRGGVKALEKYDEPTLIVIPDAVRLTETATTVNDFYSLQQMVLGQCAKLQDRFGVFDLSESSSWEHGIQEFRDNIGINSLNYAAAYTPWLETTYYKETRWSVINNHVFDTAATPALINLSNLAVDPVYNKLVTSMNNADADVAAVTTMIDAIKGTNNSITDAYNKLISDLMSKTSDADITAAINHIFDFILNSINTLLDGHGSFVNDALKKDLLGYATDTKGGLAYLLNYFHSLASQAVFSYASAPPASYHSTTWITGYTYDAANPTVQTFAGTPPQLKPLVAGDLNSHFIKAFTTFIAKIESAADKYAQIAQNSLYNQHPVISDIVTHLTKVLNTIPPSGAIVGVYSTVDGTRGVWKAPANVSLNNVIRPSYIIDDLTQEDLNISADTGKSINAIRAFTGKGIIVWGARTLDGNSNDFRYISVRRFYIMVEESVKKAAMQFVFEPNDGNTWVRVRAMIENYLTNLWRLGALAGSKPEQAFYVKVGLGRTMTFDDILNGKMIVEIGMAPVRPAEFIILRFSQIQQQA